MKILVLIHEYPPVGGGGGKVAEDICTRLIKKGHSIRLITSHFGDLPKYELKSGVEIFRVSCGRKNAFSATFMSMLIYIIRGYLTALSIIKEQRPDVIHVHFALPAGVLGWLIKKVKHIPFLMTVHLGDVPGGVPQKTDKWFRWIKPFAPAIWRSADKVVAVSNYTKELSIKNFTVPIEVIPNGVEIERGFHVKSQKNEFIQIVFAGRFVEQKNPLLVIKVLSEIKDLHWQCKMLGDGALKIEMQELINKLDLTDRISFSGWITPEQVQGILARSDILFMPSRSEGLPVVGTQALASGLAIVAGKVGGFTDLVEQGKNGFLFDPEDTKGMVNALRRYCTDRDFLQRNKKYSFEIAKRFDINKIVDKYESVLQQVAG